MGEQEHALSSVSPLLSGESELSKHRKSGPLAFLTGLTGLTGLLLLRAIGSVPNGTNQGSGLAHRY